MDERCFKEKDSNPPICGFHGVRLIQKQSGDESSFSGFGIFTFLVCPKSGKVVSDEAASIGR
jgi:hypothetical protein